MKTFITVLRSLIASRLLWLAILVAPEDEKDQYLIGALHIYEGAKGVADRAYEKHKARKAAG